MKDIPNVAPKESNHKDTAEYRVDKDGPYEESKGTGNLPPPSHIEESNLNTLEEIINNARCDEHRCSKVEQLNKEAATALHQYITRELEGLLNVVGEDERIPGISKDRDEAGIDLAINGLEYHNRFIRNKMRSQIRSAINEVIERMSK